MNNELRTFNNKKVASSNDILQGSVCYAVFVQLDVNLIHWSSCPKVQPFRGRKGIKDT